MKIGILREGKTPPDKRVPFTPLHCKLIQKKYPTITLMIQRSHIRAFSDREYEQLGLTMVNDLNDADVIFGVKEVNIEDLIPSKTYFFFSHTIKKQPYNKKLLQAILERNIDLVDYECLANQSGNRILGFGRYAGIVGTYNGFLAYGRRSERYVLKPAHLCEDKKELESELKKVVLPEGFKIAITGLGRVAGGAKEIFKVLGLEQIAPYDYLNKSYESAVYTQLSVADYFKRKNGSSFDRSEVYKSPSGFERNFLPYAKQTDLYVSCHFWDDKGPLIFTEEEMRRSDFKIRTIADISCDIAGPIASTLRPSSINDPVYEVDRERNTEVQSTSNNTISVMAVDNLPCELPRDASEGFGEDLMNKIIPYLIGEDKEKIIERATIASKGVLKGRFEYLKDYIEGKT